MKALDDYLDNREALVILSGVASRMGSTTLVPIAKAQLEEAHANLFATLDGMIEAAITEHEQDKHST